MDDYYGDDDWDYSRRRPSPHHRRSDRNEFLVPHGSSIYRTRSQGHAPQPTINVFNRMVQEQEGSPYPPYPPYPSSSSRRASPRASPEARGRSRLGERLQDRLEDEFADMVLDNRRRSRSRGQSDFAGLGQSQLALAERELARRDAELRERSRSDAWKLEQEYLKDKWKLETLEAERKRERAEEEAKEREKRVVADYERKHQDAEDKRKADEKRAVEDWERRQREAKEKAAAEEQRLKDKMERDKKEAKEKEEKAYRDFKEKERLAKEEKEREYNEFLREQKEREEKKKKQEKEEEEKFQNEMRRRLANLGYTEKTIEIMIDEEKAKKFKKEVEHKSDALEVFRGPRAPIFPKVHRDFLAVETLKYYDLPWEYDRTNSDYIIILRDMDKRQTDMLFEHTSRLRTGKLLLEPKKEKPKLAMYRRRSRSRSGAPKEIGILKFA